MSTNFLQKWKLDVGHRAGTVLSRTEGWNPPAFSAIAAGPHHLTESGSKDGTDQQHVLTKRAFDVAIGPFKQLPMKFFIMYMAGNSISIFPIMMIFMMFMRPVKALFSLGATFKGLEAEMGRSLLGQKFIYMLGNCGGVCLALYKCHSMGLLPTHASDWLDFVEAPERMEFSGGGFVWS